VNYFSCVLLSFSIILISACDIGEQPSTDPSDLYEKAISLIQEKSFRQAKPLLDQAVRSFRELQRISQLSEALTFLVQTNLELGEYRAAFKASEQAAIYMRKEGDVHGEIRIALFEGDLFRAVNMPDRAIARYRSAYSSAIAFDDKLASAEAQIKLASVLQANGDFDEALEVYKSVRTQAQTNNDPGHLASALYGIGSIYRAQQRFVEAINSLTQGLASINRTRFPLLVGRLHTEIGRVHTDQGNLNIAMADFRDAINTLRRARIGKELETIYIFQLGQLFEQSGRLVEAKKYYLDAIELAKITGDRIAENYLYIFLIQCNVALMTPEQREQNMGKLRQSYEQVAKKFQECGHSTGEGYLYLRLGRDYEQMNDFFKARDFYIKAVLLDQNLLAEYSNDELHIPYQQSLGIQPTHDDWYSALCTLLIKMQKKEEALKILEFKRSKQIASKYQNLEISLRHPKLQQRVKSARNRILQAKMLEAEYAARRGNKQTSLENRELNNLRVELETLKQTLRKESHQIIAEYPNYETLVIPEPVDANLLRKSIPRGTVAIKYLPSNDLLYIFAITRSQFEVRTSPITYENLVQSMDEYRRLLQDPSVYSGEAGEASVSSMTRFASLSTQLYDVLLRPIDDLFDQNLVVVADQLTDGFPFHAIERQGRRGDVKYVIELTSVDYLPSLGSFRYRTVSTARLQDVVAFGNPTGKNWSVDYELRDIRSFFKGARVMVGLETSWDNLKSVKADILQISTEFAQQSSELPLGNLVLSNGLMVEQSVSIPFEKLSEHDAIPVIILSNHYGEGVGLSLEHAMLLRMNGTSDIFINEWLADRKAGKFFSESFYTHLANGLAPGDAYRQALLNLIRTREVSHPRSWGQFFHFGVG